MHKALSLTLLAILFYLPAQADMWPDRNRKERAEARQWVNYELGKVPSQEQHKRAKELLKELDQERQDLIAKQKALAEKRRAATEKGKKREPPVYISSTYLFKEYALNQWLARPWKIPANSAKQGFPGVSEHQRLKPRPRRTPINTYSDARNNQRSNPNNQPTKPLTHTPAPQTPSTLTPTPNSTPQSTPEATTTKPAQEAPIDNSHTYPDSDPDASESAGFVALVLIAAGALLGIRRMLASQNK